MSSRRGDKRNISAFMQRAKHNKGWRKLSKVTMTRKDLARIIAHTVEVPLPTADQIIDVIFKYLIKRIKSDDKVYIDRFGEFHKMLRDTARHLGGSKPTKYTIYFRCSETLAKLMRQKWYEWNNIPKDKRRKGY